MLKETRRSCDRVATSRSTGASGTPRQLPARGGGEGEGGGAQTPPGSPRPPRLLVITPAVFVCRGSLGARRRSVIMEKIIKTQRGDNSHLHIVRSGKFSF